MSETTKISWCDSTWNPWRGCSKVSLGCKNCYAEELVNRRLSDFSKRTRAKPATFNAPLKWNQQPWVCDVCGKPVQDKEKHLADYACSYGFFHRRRVFLGSLMDWLDPNVPVEWLADALDIVRRCPELDFLCLTKRPEQWRHRLDECLGRMVQHWQAYSEQACQFARNWIFKGNAPANAWVGTSIEDQTSADKRIPELLKIPAAGRFISAEPLLGRIDLLNKWERAKWLAGIHWVIIGGESGPRRRDCGVEAIVDVVEQCQAAGVPCFVKQDCAARPGQQGRIPENIWNIKQLPTL